jgi:hypothetical protein
MPGCSVHASVLAHYAYDKSLRLRMRAAFPMPPRTHPIILPSHNNVCPLHLFHCATPAHSPGRHRTAVRHGTLF